MSRKITKDKILNNITVTNESQQPRYRGLPPAQSQPRGSIVYDFITNKFWGRVREGWSTMSGGTSSGPVIVSPDSQFERVVYPNTAISATVGKTIVSGGEPGVARWGARVAGVSDDFGRGIAMNDFGDIVATHIYYSSPLEIYNAGGTISDISLPNSGGQDTFIAKWNSDGEAKWAARVAGVNGVYGTWIGINRIGDIVATGYYQNTVEIYNAGGTLSNISLPNSGFTDAFIAKWNAYGEAQWATRVAGVSSDDGWSIAINDLESIVATGRYENTVEIYNAGGTLSNISLPNSGFTDAFIAKWNASGETQWATRVAGVSADFGYSIAMNDLGNIVATGYYQNTVEIYNAGGTLSNISLPNSGTFDVFIAKWNAYGEAQWATRVAGVSDDYPGGIATNDLGDIVATGVYNSSPIQIYNAGGTLSNISLPFSGGNDVFVAKWDSDGNAKWAARVAGIDDDFVDSAGAINNNGNIVVTGGYNSSPIYIYNANGSTAFSLPFSGTNYDTFVAKWNSDGEAIWATHIACVNDDSGYGVALNNRGDIVVTGTFDSSPVEIYNSDGNLAFTLPNSGGYDAFVVKFSDQYAEMTLANPTVDGLVKRISSGDSQTLVKPFATVNFTQEDILLYPSTSVVMMWDAVSQNWIINSLTGTLV